MNLFLILALLGQRGGMLADPVPRPMPPPAPVSATDPTALATAIAGALAERLNANHAELLAALKAIPAPAATAPLDSVALANQIGDAVGQQLRGDRLVILDAIKSLGDRPTSSAACPPCPCNCSTCVCSGRAMGQPIERRPTAQPGPPMTTPTGRRMLPRFTSLQETQAAGWFGAQDASGKWWKADNKADLDAYLAKRNAEIARVALDRFEVAQVGSIQEYRAAGLAQQALMPVTNYMPAYQPSYTPMAGYSMGGGMSYGSFGSPMMGGSFTGMGGGCSTGNCN